jgi:hypothetical protein
MNVFVPACSQNKERSKKEDIDEENKSRNEQV